MGDRITFIRLAMPSEYGEIGYPVGMTHWLVPQKHVHAGFWCGDAEARKSFRAAMLRKYAGLAGVNAAWATHFAQDSEVTYPDLDAAPYRVPANAGPRRRWLDFIDWYQGSQGEFMRFAAGAVKKAFPRFGLPQAGTDLRSRKEIIFSLGYGGETPCTGNDEGRHVKVMRQVGASAQTPGDIGYFATRRVSTACRFYGVPYYTEPPGDVDRNREVRRLWMDSSHGSQVFFDYPNNLDRARDLVARYQRHLTGKPSVTDVALLIGTANLYLRPDWGFPPYAMGIGETMRHRFDYEVVDEAMITEGALAKLGIRVAVLTDTEYMEAAGLRALARWVRAGGVLVTANQDVVRDVAGSDALWRAIAPPRAPESALGAADFWQKCSRRVGKGAVVSLPGSPLRMADHAVALAGIHDHLAQLLPGATAPGPRVDTGDSGLWASLFPDRITLYNNTGKSVEGTIKEAGGGWGAMVGRLASDGVRVAVEPNTIVEVKLAK